MSEITNIEEKINAGNHVKQEDLMVMGDVFQKRVEYNGRQLTLYLNRALPQKSFELVSYSRDGRKILRNLTSHQYYLYSNSTGLEQMKNGGY